MPSGRSIWHVHPPHFPSLSRDLKTDVAVIGGGMAGVQTAWQLAKRGVKTVVLEAACIGSGQTKNTTAKITSQHGMICDALIQRFGHEKASQYAQANEYALEEYRSIIRKQRIDCDFCEVPAYLYSCRDADALRHEAESAQTLGLPASFTQTCGLPFPVAGAVRFDRQAQFHPLRFLYALSKGMTIYENTPVTRVEDRFLFTPHGVVTAEKIIFASHFPFVNIPGWYFMRMHQERSYVLALNSGWLPDGIYYGVDPDGLSFREAEGMLLLGGGNHRTGENSAGGKYELLRQCAQELCPGCREEAHWSAQDCITLDGVPYIGQFSHTTPNWYVATGFAKWGMSTSMVSALLLSGMICGQTPDWAEVFSPLRLKLSASAQSLATDTAQALKGLTREWLQLPQQTLEALPCGHGGIVETEGRKAGVYKDEHGRCHIIDPRCPHLGCQLEWNPDEMSWDCPCHGSRFTMDGERIDNPAQEGLK